jgi:succinylglutamic semialdehyde dehydrogenase
MKYGFKLVGKNFIHGEWRAHTNDSFNSINPATGEIVWEGMEADSEDINNAVLASQQAFTIWRSLSVSHRQAYITNFVAVIEQKKDALARAIHDETGKPLWESKTEITSIMGKADLSVNSYHARTGVAENDTLGARLEHRPIGVFAVLGPYNFPGHLPNGHIIPALLAGNVIVFKPSELTPMFGELMMHCWVEAGLPVGVLNVVQGGRKTGELLTKHNDISGLLFTGSSSTGIALHRQFAGHPEKMLALEMGVNNPLIIEHSQDIRAAIYTIIQSAFISSGQRCTCARRLIVKRTSENEELVNKLIVATAAIKVGQDDTCFMGPVITNSAADNILAMEQQLLKSGGQALLPVRRLDPQRPFLQPGIIDVTDVQNLADEECFGPLLQLIWVKDLGEAIDIANQTQFGLSAGLLSDNKESWQTFYKASQAGIVNWNKPLTGASGSAPFGGTGSSGNFRPGAFYAADYSAYPVASLLSPDISLPEKLAPGIIL